MAGDDLAIFGILWGTAIAFALAAVTMLDSGRKKLVAVLWATSGVLIVPAILWPWIGEKLPLMKEVLAAISENTPALKIVGAAIFCLIGLDFSLRSRRLGKPDVPKLEASGTDQQQPFYSDDPHGEALDKDAYNRIVAFCMDSLLPACESQIQLQEALIRHLCSNKEIADLAIHGTRLDWRYKTRGFWENYGNLASGLVQSPGPMITFNGMLEYIFELEREFYKNFCDETFEIAQSGGIELKGCNMFAADWIKWEGYHQQMVAAYEAIKRDIRFGKLHRLRPSRWGDYF